MTENHRHEAYEIYDAATKGDIDGLRSYIDGLRHDLGQAEERIRELDTGTAQLRRDVAELREQADPDEIEDLKQRVQTLVSVLASHLAASGLPAAAQALGGFGGNPDE